MSNDRYRIPEALDWRGNLITEGAMVVYPRQMGDLAELMEATVLEVWRREEDRWDGRAQYVYRLQPTKSSRFERSGGRPRAAVWIQNGENVTLV